MESFVELEPRLPARGRYTLVHLLLPHMPYVLRSDCSREGTATTDLEQQSRCTLRLLVRFLDTLRRLDRLDGSILVVHGDHGSGEILREGRLVSDEPASLRTALLFKPVGGHGPMRRAGRTARLVDIAPTLLAMLGIAREAPFDGTVLEEALPEGGGGPYVATRRGAAGPGD
jgi:phosphoglycerol transferase MdoB-like AlkP superfamily enzyme